MNERTQLGWLARRLGLGLVPGQLDDWVELGIDSVVDLLVDGDSNGAEMPSDPFAGLDRRPENPGVGIREAASAWLSHAATSPRPFESWVNFFWHDYFAVSAPVVRSAGFVHDHFRLLTEHGLGDFDDLLGAVTIDAAMLVFLDGAKSTGRDPNENYGRELLELYSVGVGNFTENDVRAAAVALTGWVVSPRADRVSFRANRHDATSQVLLGVEDVHDVQTVIDAVTRDPACVNRVVSKVVTAVLGKGADPELVARHAKSFGETLSLRPLFRSLIEDALDGAAQPIIIEPVPWFVSCVRATGAEPRSRGLAQSFRATGQVVMNPPNVGGFPGAKSYLSTSATVARFNIASAVAEATPPASAARVAARRGDLGSLADSLGLESFSAPTTAALREMDRGVDVLALALASPDVLIA